MPRAPTIDSRLRLVELAIFGIHPEADAETRQACAEEHCANMAPAALEAEKKAAAELAAVAGADSSDPGDAVPAATLVEPVAKAPPLGPARRKELQQRCTYLDALNGRRENAIKSCRERAIANDDPGTDHWAAQADSLKALQDTDGKQLEKLKLELA